MQVGAPCTLYTRHDDSSLTEIELALRELWAGCLSECILKSTSITSRSGFFHLGGNSYLLVRLQGLIQERFNILVPIMTLYDASTLTVMAFKTSSGESVIPIDWQAETSVTQALIAAPSNHSTQPCTAPRKTSDLSIVFTGSTGYLGSRILKSLVESEHISKIHCIAVRGHPDSTPRNLGIKSEKLILDAGDFTEPLLGMSEEESGSLAEEADLIIHSGANRAFWDYYDKLRGPNVTSTKYLVDLASRNNTPLHFISSGGVHLLSQLKQYPAESVAAFKPPSDGSNGYIASKWVSEIYLENAAKQLTLPIHIHRLTPAPEITPDSPMELLEELANLATKLQALPAPSGWTGTFDLTPADTLAADLATAAIVAQASTDPTSKAQFVNHASEVKLSMDIVAQYLDMLPSAESFDKLPPLQWAGRAKKEGLTWHFSSTDFITMGGVSGVGLRR